MADISTKKFLTSIRSAIRRHLRNLPHMMPFFIVSNSLFTGANKTLNNFLKTQSKTSKIARNVHKSPLTNDTLIEK